MAKKKEERPDPRALALKSTSFRRTLYEDPELGPLVLRAPGSLTATKIQREEDDLERMVQMNLRLVFRPVFGPDGEVLFGDDGDPLVGPPLFEPADAEVLRTTDYDKDAWFFRLPKAIGAFATAERKEADVGKKSAAS